MSSWSAAAPPGATAAEDLARSGQRVALLDRAGRIKPCGGAIPPRLIADFAIPDDQLVAKITTARMISPTGRRVDIPIENGFVGMVDREHFDEFLRARAAAAGRHAAHRHLPADRARRATAPIVVYRDREGQQRQLAATRRHRRRRRAVRRGACRGARAATRSPTSSPTTRSSRRRGRPRTYDPDRCDVVYDGAISPDFYGWVFPHGGQCSRRHGQPGEGRRPQGRDRRPARRRRPRRRPHDPPRGRADPAEAARPLGQRPRRGAGGRCGRRRRAVLGRGHLLRDGRRPRRRRRPPRRSSPPAAPRTCASPGSGSSRNTARSSAFLARCRTPITSPTTGASASSRCAMTSTSSA